MNKMRRLLGYLIAALGATACGLFIFTILFSTINPRAAHSVQLATGTIGFFLWGPGNGGEMLLSVIYCVGAIGCVALGRWVAGLDVMPNIFRRSTVISGTVASAPATSQHKNRVFLSFVLEEHDATTGATRRSQVEMSGGRGQRMRGTLADGETVEVTGIRNKTGVILARGIANQSTSSRIAFD